MNNALDWTNLLRLIHENGLEDEINLNQIDFLSFSDLELDEIEDIFQGLIDNIKNERANRAIRLN